MPRSETARRSTRLCLALLAIFASGAAEAAQKYDAQVERLLADPQSAWREHATVKSFARGEGRVFVEALVRFAPGGLERLKDEGVRVRTTLGDVASVEIPLERLGSVAMLPEVEYIEGSKPLRARLHVSVPATRANLLRSGNAPAWGGLTGRGVIVGIVDDGMDFRHLDFRNPDGSTRLLGLWDQRASGVAGASPAGFGYGGECTTAMIAAAIAGDATACTQPSTGNHGTHVGGIAAGNGQQTGNGMAPYRFVGMAPEADILSANSIGDGVSSSNAVVDAVSWMKGKAQAAGKPLAINLSLGSYYGARDGTSNYERALTNAGAAGVVLVGAGGNEGSDPIRAAGTLAQGQTVSVSLDWASSVKKDQQIELWYPGASEYAIRLVGPGGCQTDFVTAGSRRSFALACGTIEVNSTAPQANNDDRQISVSLVRSATDATLMQGAWTLELRGDVVAGGSAPFSIICADDGNSLRFTSHTEPVTRGILTDTASATGVIGVAAYNTNYAWTVPGGAANSPPSNGALGDIAGFSSRGPRRDCSNAAKCPPAMKPEIAAPGSMIISAFGHDATASGDNLESDGKHIAAMGTSMASPHVAGAVALMLQRNPTLTPSDVRRLLAQSRQGNGFTAAAGVATYDPASPLMPANPNYTWGYGILDAQAAANATTTSTPGGLAATDNVTGLWWNAAESGWGVNFNHQGTLLFGTLFTYAADGSPLWLVMPSGAQQADGSFRGAIYQTTGPAFNAMPFPPLGGGVGSVTEVGTMQVTFASRSQATLGYTFNGVTVSKAITPQAFGPLQSCAHAAPGSRAGRTNYTDLWWVPAESGWGANVTHQGDTLFAAMFNYVAGTGNANRGVWWVMSAGVRQADGTYSGDLYQVSGPAFNASQWGAVTVARVGSMRFAFSDGVNGTLTYDVNGASVTKAIVPQVFGTQAPSCTRGS